MAWVLAIGGWATLGWIVLAGIDRTGELEATFKVAPTLWHQLLVLIFWPVIAVCWLLRK